MHYVVGVTDVDRRTRPGRPPRLVSARGPARIRQADPRAVRGRILVAMVALGGLATGIAAARLPAPPHAELALVAMLVAMPCMAFLATYWLYARERSERTRLGLLYELARAFGGARDVDAVVRTVLQRSRELLRAERAELLLLPPDSEGQVLRVRVAGDAGALVEPADEAMISAAIVAAQRGNLPRAPRDRQTALALADLGARDAVTVPLRGEAGALGCLAVLDRAGDLPTFGAQDLRLLEMFAGQAATSLGHARIAAELHELAYHDGLTGLANRALFLRRLDAAARRRSLRSADAGVIAIAYLDLDDFKTVNDSLGHSAGDRLLVEVAARLRSCLRAGDLASRLGGDEFAVLFENVEGQEEAVRIADRLLDLLRRPVRVDGAWLSARASAGVIVVPREGEVDAGTLLGKADVAMYRAKSRGKGGVELFEPSMQAGADERHHLKADLEAAVRDGGLRVVYQPLVSLASREIVGVEALVRWEHPERGAVPPAEFIPVAEETGLVHQLGAVVLETACRQAAAWQRVRPGLALSINVSGRQLLDPGFPEAVATALRSTGLDAALLTLEVTESVIVTDDRDIRKALRALRDIGCRVAIDDFGSGQSSLTSLRELPVDALKIAKPFIDGVGCGPQGEAFAEAIIGLGRTLGLTTIAEGVESPEQARRLGELHCSMGQGYLFARPRLADDVELELVGEAGAHAAPAGGRHGSW